MDELGRDLRHALKTLGRAPGFAAVVVLTLALGIGANTAIFTLMDQVLLRMLPVRDPERLVILDAPGPFSGHSSTSSLTLTPLSHPMFEGLRDRNDVFAGVLAEIDATVHLTAGGRTEQASAALVSGTFFETLGVGPAVGRVLSPEDDRAPGGSPFVVLGHGFWVRRFGGDPSVVGQLVTVNGEPMTVVGVAAAGFHGVEVGAPTDVYVPLAMQERVTPTLGHALGNWRTRFLTVMARLEDGVALERARAGANVRYAQLLQEDLAHLESRSERLKTEFAKKQLVLLPGGRGTSGLRDQTGTPLLVLMGMVGLVLLIACANVANLLLVRAAGRQKEIALRLALGASRMRLVRQHLVESVVLALAGGLAGLLFAAWSGEALLRALPGEGATRVLSAQPDLRVGAFTLGLSLATGVLFGLLPALRATRVDLAPTLKDEAGALVGGTGSFRLRRGLVVVQVALSLLLLVGSGLFARSLMNLRALDPGFSPRSLLEFSVDPALNGYDAARREQVFGRIADEVAAEPGVESVSMAELALMSGSDSSSTVRVQGYEPRKERT